MQAHPGGLVRPGGGALVVPGGPGAAVVGQHAGIGVHHRAVGLVADGAQDLAFACIGVLQQRLEVLNALVAGKKLALRNARLLLQSRVLVDELRSDLVSPRVPGVTDAMGDTYLLLDKRELLQVALQERHLLLLGAVV